jgi:hypothetical protein
MGPRPLLRPHHRPSPARRLTRVDGVGREIDTTYNTFGEPLTVTAPNPSAVGPPQLTTSAYNGAGNLSVKRPLYTSETTFSNPQDVTGVVDWTRWATHRQHLLRYRRPSATKGSPTTPTATAHRDRAIENCGSTARHRILGGYTCLCRLSSTRT